MIGGSRSEWIRWWIAVSALALAGLALRIAAARGALWTDEAWSMVYAVEARDAAGVFLRINHDNNHHLYSLWLQAIGMGASPQLARAPAILAGTLGIVVAALLVGCRSRIAGIIAAALFACSPIFVNFGSEARGYAMMLLAALTTLWLVAEAVEGREKPGTRWYLALAAGLGMFSHLTMVAPVGLAALWFYLERRSAVGPSAAMRETVRLMGPSLGAIAAVLLFVFAAAAASPTGMRLGGYSAFAIRDYEAALDDLGLWSVGLTGPGVWLVPVMTGALALIIAFRPPPWLGSRARLYALLILGVPVAVFVLRPGNAGYARYYLASGLGLLLLMSEWIGRGLAARGAPRAAAGALLAIILLASGIRDFRLIALQRGEPDRPIRDMVALSPAGTDLALPQPRLEAVVKLAAQRIGYPLRFAGRCDPAEFALVAQERWSAIPSSIHRCGVMMRATDSSIASPITGDSWVLYRAESLQSIRPPVSAPVPGRSELPPPRRRAGVAQG